MPQPPQSSTGPVSSETTSSASGPAIPSHETTHVAPNRNPGTTLDLAWLNAEDDTSPTKDDRGSKDHGSHNDIAPLPASYVQAVSLLDLTSLSLHDTPADIDTLCENALMPLPNSVLEGLGGIAGSLTSGEELHISGGRITTAGVCVYPAFIPQVRDRLEASPVRIATVAGGFPTASAPLSDRIREIEEAARLGVHEIDAVIARKHVLAGAWRVLYNEVREYRQASGESHLKVILGTGELETSANIRKASLVAMMAGADFVKTSTGKEAVNATLPAGIAMAGAIRNYFERTGVKVGLKPAGGIRAADEALRWSSMVRHHLGDAWLTPRLFRFGASALLADLRHRLEASLAT